MPASIGSIGKAAAGPWPGRGRRHWTARVARPTRVAGIFGAAVAAAMTLPACMSAGPSSAAAAGATQPAVLPGMSCAWPDKITAQTDNTAFPDAAAAYYGQPIVASAGTRIVLSGRFPDARYASV